MPYTSISDLPPNIPKNKRRQFKEVFNSVFEDTKDEGRAMAAAYSAIKKSYRVGDKVSWNSSGGTARGIIRQIVRSGKVPDIPVKVTGSEEEPAARIEIVDDKGNPTGEMVGHKMSTLRKNFSEIYKARYANDVFTTEAEARSRAMDMGLDGRTHVEAYENQAVYMPGGSHEEYLAYYEDDAPEVQMDTRMEAFRMILQEIFKFQDWGEEVEVSKAEYQGKKVELNKPRRLSGENKKFEVFVKDGDKIKRVTFGDPNMEIRRDDPDARAAFRARHSCDTAKDKTSARYWSCRMWEKGTSVSEMTKNIEGQVLKSDDEQRLVYGWASVITEKGEPVVDRQGDVIKADTLVQAVNEFMEDVRVGKAMHSGDQIGVVVHSWPVTDEIAKAVGIQSDREGWLVAFKVYNDDVWAKVKSGELAAFSIGGRATKEAMDA